VKYKAEPNSPTVCAKLMPRGYKAYPNYKDSGVEWLGEIPDYWVSSKFGFLKTVLTDYTANGSFADLAKNVTYKDTESYARLVRLTDLRKNLSNSNGVWVEESAYRFLKKSALFGGEFLMANVGAYAGLFYKMPYISVPATLAPNMFMAKFNEFKVTPNYMAYVGTSDGANKQLRLNATASSAQPKLNKDDFKSINFTYPPLQEQKSIANYLDKATAKIDTLIEKQTKLIQLLKEKRQAVISSAVTRGLDASVPMKDSGVEWLGAIPEGWTINTLRRDLIEHKQGFYSTEDYNDEGVKLLRITDIKESGKVDSTFCPRVNMYEKDKHFLLKNGDFVFARTGGAGSFGLIKNIQEEILFASYLIRFRFKPSIYSEYLKYFFMSLSFTSSISSNIHGGVNKNIHAEDIKDCFISKPSLDEQKTIAKYLVEITSKIDNLIIKSTKAIDLLKEKRTALISAAVTGKIDVRDAA